MFPGPDQTRAREREWFAAHPEREADALREAARGLARAITCHFPQPGTLLVVAGLGHNGADALLAAADLLSAGWVVQVAPVFLGRPPSAATRAALDTLLAQGAEEWACDQVPEVGWPRPWVVLDGICGIGARLPLAGLWADAVRSILRWREHHGAHVVAVDLPSGLDGESGKASDPCVIADLTVTMAVVKRGLVLAPRESGRVVLVPLATLPPPDQESGPTEVLITADLIGPWLPPRPHDLHKGTAGKIAIVAGSPGMTGAAALCAMGALHGGAGLVTVFCAPEAVAEVSLRCSPEIMVRSWPSSGLTGIPAEEFTAIAVGPGIGRSLDGSLPGFVRHCPVPLVLDADALNGLARSDASGWFGRGEPPAARLLTPHPGEFARLAPDLADGKRAEVAGEFSRRYPGCALLLKGSRTIVTRHGYPVAYNQTGNSGLASGGSGDVLAGLAAALLARLPDPWQTGCAATWLHGRAAELALTHGNESPESLHASATARWLGQAWSSLRRRDP